MSIKRDADGKVTLRDLEKAGRKLRVNAPTAREALKNNPGRYVTDAKWNADINQRRIDEAVAEKVAEATSNMGGDKPSIVASSNNEIDDKIIEVHNTVLDEAEDGDERITPSRILKMKVLSELVGREIDRSEYSKYSQYIQTAREAQEGSA